MNLGEKILCIIAVLIACFAIFVFPALYFGWSFWTTLSIWSIIFILLFIRG